MKHMEAIGLELECGHVAFVAPAQRNWRQLMCHACGDEHAGVLRRIIGRWKP